MANLKWLPNRVSAYFNVLIFIYLTNFICWVLKGLNDNKVWIYFKKWINCGDTHHQLSIQKEKPPKILLMSIFCVWHHLISQRFSIWAKIVFIEIGLRQHMRPQRLHLKWDCNSAYHGSQQFQTKPHSRNFNSFSLRRGKSQPDRDEVYACSSPADHQWKGLVGTDFIFVKPLCDFPTLFFMPDFPSLMRETENPWMFCQHRGHFQARQCVATPPSAGLVEEENGDNVRAGLLDSFHSTALGGAVCSLLKQIKAQWLRVSLSSL